MDSIYQNLGGGIEIPEFKSRQLYMHKTSMDNVIMPTGFEDYASVIDKILGKVKDRGNVCYITIDEKQVCNDTHRRSGIHVDFNWFENLKAHGENYGAGTHRNSGGGAVPGSGGHGSGYGGGTHGNPNIPSKGNGNHNGSPPSTHSCLEEHNKNGGMLLVSNYPGCRAYTGQFSGVIGEGGCCKDIDVSALKSEVMKPNEVYFVNALGIHESLKIEGPINRTVIRINFHPEYVLR